MKYNLYQSESRGRGRLHSGARSWLTAWLTLSGLSSRKPKGVALVMVLLMILLLSGMIVTYLSHSMMQHQLSNQNAAQIKADLLAHSALALIVADLRHEITLGSDPTIRPFIYIPKSTESIQPEPNGLDSSMPNLIRRSLRNDPISVPSRASAVNSTEDLSANGRSVSLAQWNAHYLLPKVSAINDSSEPVINFKAPDWVIVTRQEIAVKILADLIEMRDRSSPCFAIGRYAYAIYDEGGLLDMNVAGYDPSLGLLPELTSAKGSIAFAELTCLPGLGTTQSLNDIFGWRNYATLKAHGDFDLHNFTFEAGNQYSNFVLNNPTGFLQTSNAIWNHHTDQMFVSRQALIQMRRCLAFSVNSLSYLGTFSRDLNLPTLKRALQYRVSKPFTRRDGSQSEIGEQLLHRFSLERLNELTQSDPGAIQRDFGLIALSGSDHDWGYYGTSGTIMKSSLDSSWVNGDRDPDFFELIGFLIREDRLPLVLTLGADLMDQFDADIEPTTLCYLAGSSTLMIHGTESQSFLNRPCQSVGEMRYVANTTDDMLDLFCARNLDESLFMRAGVVNRNTRNYMAFAAILAGAYKNPSDLKTGISDSSAIAAAKTLVTNAVISAQARGEGLARIIPNSGDVILMRRALADVATTRVWNLMIDVIAQSGRYPPAAKYLAQFMVDGESRYWLHIALDRFTGKILDVQLESVHE